MNLDDPNLSKTEVIAMIHFMDIIASRVENPGPSELSLMSSRDTRYRSKMSAAVKLGKANAKRRSKIVPTTDIRGRQSQVVSRQPSSQS